MSRTVPTRCVFDAKTAERSGYFDRRQGAHRHGVRPGAADAHAGGHRSTSRRAARSTARRSRSSTPRPRRSCSSTARTPTPTSGSPPRTACPRRSCATRWRGSCPTGFEAVTGDEAADESASDLLEAISFLRTFLLIFAGISLVVGAFLIVNTFSILVAQRSRELALLRALGASKRQVTRSVLLEAFVARRRSAPRSGWGSACCWPWASGRSSPTSASTWPASR